MVQELPRGNHLHSVEGRIVKNGKTEDTNVVGAMSEFAGGLAGRLVVVARDIGDCAKSLVSTKVEPKQTSPAKASGSIRNQAREMLDEMEEATNE